MERTGLSLSFVVSAVMAATLRRQQKKKEAAETAISVYL